METKITNSFSFIRKYFALIALLVAGSIYLFSQPQGKSLGADRDVIPGYQGWTGDPDTLTVYIDTSFTAEEKDSIRTAISRWNDAGSVPRLRETSDAPGNISFTRHTFVSDTLGLCTNSTDANGDVTSSTIQIGEDQGGLTLSELATHEIGHALGLADTEEAANPSDVMKGTGPTNGSDGALSAHDSTELAAAGAAAVAEDTDEKVAMNPMAIMPGTFAMLDFDLGEVFPPDIIDQTGVLVSPIGDPYLFVESAFIEANLLRVGVFSDPTHGSGKLYLNVDLLFPEPYPVMHFRGVHYINILPAEPVTFECPFSFNENDGYVHINWVEQCTYPLQHQLRAELVVDGTEHIYQRGGGNYTLMLEPGPHVIELYVDDYQVNNAYYAQNILVTGVPESEKAIDFVVYPNPFSQLCRFECPDDARIIVYDMSGNVVKDLPGGTKYWKPSIDLPFGIYFIQFIAEDQIKTLKIIYKN
jgi:hypothetical protein